MRREDFLFFAAGSVWRLRWWLLCKICVNQQDRIDVQSASLDG